MDIGTKQAGHSDASAHPLLTPVNGLCAEACGRPAWSRAGSQRAKATLRSPLRGPVVAMGLHGFGKAEPGLSRTS